MNKNTRMNLTVHNKDYNFLFCQHIHTIIQYISLCAWVWACAHLCMCVCCVYMYVHMQEC